MADLQKERNLFTNRQPIRSILKITEPVKYESIFGTLNEQQEVVHTLMMIEETRIHMKQHISLGGVCSQDLCKFSFVLDHAAYIISS